MPFARELVGATHLLYGEDDAGKRRVEGARDAGGGAREDQPARLGHTAEARRRKHE